MDILDHILQRRSIRAFKDTKIDEETIVKLLQAAMAAPTACNNQPWEFVVITDDDIVAKLKSRMTFGNYSCPLIIAVCGNLKLAKGGMENYWVQDCSAAMENILLAASGLGLGSVWVGVYPLPSVIKPVSEVLNLPSYVVPLGLAYIGYPKEEKEPRTQYNEKRVYWQQYDQNRKHRSRPKNLKDKGTFPMSCKKDKGNVPLSGNVPFAQHTGQMKRPLGWYPCG